MNCRFTPIDERNGVVGTLVHAHWLQRMALQHSPGEGPGAPS